MADMKLFSTAKLMQDASREKIWFQVPPQSLMRLHGTSLSRDLLHASMRCSMRVLYAVALQRNRKREGSLLSRRNRIPMRVEDN